MTAALASDYGLDRRMARGLLCSLLLHLLLALFLWRAPWPPANPRGVSFAVPIDLVSPDEENNSPIAAQKSALPQLRARETAEHPEHKAVPLPKVAPEPSAPELSADDPLSRKLQLLAQWQQPDSHLPPSPNLQDGAGISNVTTSSAAGAKNGRASYAIKDYLREQIERRWVLPDGALQRNDWVVRLHLQIKEDGHVIKAEIVDDPRLREDSDFRDFALSARNAALLSSPLVLPEQSAEMLRDVELDFNPRQVQQ